MLRKCLAAAAIVFGSCGASANPASHTYSFDFTNFEAGAPVDPVTGTVRVTFDPALSTVGSPVDAIGLTIGGQNPQRSRYLASLWPDSASHVAANRADPLQLRQNPARMGVLFADRSDQRRRVSNCRLVPTLAVRSMNATSFGLLG